MQFISGRGGAVHNSKDHSQEPGEAEVCFQEAYLGG